MSEVAVAPKKDLYPKLNEELMEKYNRKMVYVITPNMKSTAAIFRRANPEAHFTGDPVNTNKAIPIPVTYEFTDKDGKARRTRYKPHSQYIDVQPQIKEEGILANDKFPHSDRDRLRIQFGKIEVTDAYTNWYLSEDNCPNRRDFTGKSRGTHIVMIELLDEEKEINAKSELIDRQLDAGNAIRKMSTEQVRELLVHFFGSSFTQPENEKAAKNLAIESMSDNELRIKIVEDYSEGKKTDIDAEVKILVNKGLNSGILRFDISGSQVMLKRNGQFENVKLIAADTIEQQEILFMQFLTTPEGAALRSDIEGLTTVKKAKTK